MRARWPRALAALCLLLAGCAIAPAEPPRTNALLDQVPADVPHHARSNRTLIVSPAQARAALDTQQMAYTQATHQLAYFARNQWAETPPQMLGPLLVRTMEATGAFTAVVAPPHATDAAIGLRTEIVDLVQDFATQPPVLRLALRVRVEDEETGRVLGTREIAVQESMREATPAAGVQAANDAMAKALRELAAFVLAQLP
jgi:cholesterol transport system auxiliary component